MWIGVNKFGGSWGGCWFKGKFFIKMGNVRLYWDLDIRRENDDFEEKRNNCWGNWVGKRLWDLV